jgi:hypothetical protein
MLRFVELKENLEELTRSARRKSSMPILLKIKHLQLVRVYVMLST